MPPSPPGKEKKKKKTEMFFRIFYSQQGRSTVYSSKCIFVNNCQVFILVKVTRERKRENELGEVKQININTKITPEHGPSQLLTDF